MNYEEKYKEALERAKDYYKVNQKIGDSEENEVLSDIFPELAESEDEGIRKDLIGFFKDESFLCHKKEDILAWLEKQGNETKVSYTTIVETGDGGINALVTRELSTDGCDDEQKPADMVEPKFKVEKGKWYVCIRGLLDNYANKAFHKGDTYLSTQDGSLIPSNSNVPFEVVCPDTYFRNWDISDAKDGDVLVGKIDGDDYILIFKQIKDGWVETYGHYYDVVDRFCVPSQLFCRDYTGTFHPATKEQRGLLFQKMHEAGYEWDAEKKELKKISQRMISSEAKETLYDKPTWSEEDERICSCLIEEQEESLDNVENDKYGHSEIISDLKEMYRERIDWLKSLKRRIG